MIAPPPQLRPASYGIGVVVGFLVCTYNVLLLPLTGVYAVDGYPLLWYYIESLMVGIAATLIHSYRVVKSPRYLRSSLPFLYIGLRLWLIIVLPGYAYYYEATLGIYLFIHGNSLAILLVLSFIMSGIWQALYVHTHNTVVQHFTRSD